MNKYDQVLDVLLQGLDAKQIWHHIFNKMTNKAKRQLIGELLNCSLGSYCNINDSIFEIETPDVYKQRISLLEENDRIQDEQQDKIAPIKLGETKHKWSSEDLADGAFLSIIDKIKENTHKQLSLDLIDKIAEVYYMDKPTNEDLFVRQMTFIVNNF